MTDQKPTYEIILFYKYVDMATPENLVKEQKVLCERLGLKGRIIVAKEGINGTLEGTKTAIDEYCKDLTSRQEFSDINIKRSRGTGNAFPKLSIKIRKEIVSASLVEDVDPKKTSGKYLSADELQSWVKDNKDFCIVDMRNDYEYAIGHFENSVLLGMKNFRDLPEVLPRLESLKGKTVVTVCTGGVRCEKASGFLVKNGFKDVYQLHNGIVTYMEKYPGQAFKGKLYVFDDRISMDFDTLEQHTVIGKCQLCKSSSEDYVNCAHPPCNRHFICCKDCLNKDGKPFCSSVCEEIYHQKTAA